MKEYLHFVCESIIEKIRRYNVSLINFLTFYTKILYHKPLYFMNELADLTFEMGDKELIAVHNNWAKWLNYFEQFIFKDIFKKVKF